MNTNNNQQTTNAKWLRVMRQIITGDPSRAREKWDGLKSEQRLVICQAAHLPEYYSRYKWIELDFRETYAIYKGLTKIQNIISCFKGCIAADFKPQQKQINNINTQN